LEPGDLLVVNRSATLPASLPAEGAPGPFILNLSTRYAPALWLTEPRWSAGQPGPLPLTPGERIVVAGVKATLLSPYPGLPRLWFALFDGAIDDAMQAYGQPIRYGYAKRPYPLEAYQTLFADTPGRQEEIERMWLRVLDLPPHCLRKSVVNVYSKYSSKKRRNKLPYGTCRVVVSRTSVVQSIYGAIQEYAGIDRPEWLDL
jgi:hypothetical protein